MPRQKCSKVGLAEQVIKPTTPTPRDKSTLCTQHLLFPNILTARKTSRCVSRAAWLSRGLLAELQCKQAAHRRRKKPQPTKGGIQKHCPLSLREVRAQLQLRLERNANKQTNNTKGNKNSSYCCPSSTRLKKEDVGELLTGVWDLARVVHAFASLFTNKV